MSWKAAFGIRETTAVTVADSDEHHHAGHVQWQTPPQSHNQAQRPSYHARGHVDEHKPPQAHIQRSISPNVPFEIRPDAWGSALGDRMGIAMLLLSSLFMMQSFAIFVILYKLLSAGL